MDYRTVLDAVESWPVAERVRLVRDVSDRLADQGIEPDLSDEWKAELDRRIEQMDRDPASGVPWEVIKARVLANFGR